MAYKDIRHKNGGVAQVFAGITLALLCLIFIMVKSSNLRNNRISAIVVPHHNLVQEQREKLFEEIAPRISPATVILLSPNHYESGKANIQTTTQTWDITEGLIQPNKKVIDSLLQTNLASEEQKSFVNEHGIKLILTDIKRFFPQAQIVPIIFKMGTSEKEIAELQTTLKKKCQNCLVIASVDFSHYQPALLAELHDSLTLRALNNLDSTQLLTKAEVDSPPALSLLVKWADSHNTKRFVLQNHTNAGIIANDPDVETTTHFFGWYERGRHTENAQSVSFTLGGLVSLNQEDDKASSNKTVTTLFNQLGDRTFWGADTNLLSSKNKVDEQNSLYDKVATYLKATIVQPTASQPTITNVKGDGYTLSIISIAVTDDSPDLNKTITSVKRQSNNKVIIHPLWSADTMAQHDQNRKLAHSWIDAGADAVIGTDGITAQNSELYKDAPIFYSTGSFIDQKNNTSISAPSLIVAGQFYNKELQLLILPAQEKDNKPILLRGLEKTVLLEKLYQPFQAQQQKTPAGTMLIFPEK